jgi:hypothetical protein
MKKYSLLILILIPFLHLYGQEAKIQVEGKVSYITMQNIYVKFDQPGIVHPGDTIFIRNNQVLIPLFVSESVSSTSSVGKPIGKPNIQVSDVVILKIPKPAKPAKRNVNEIVPSQLTVNPQDSGRTQPTKFQAKTGIGAGHEQKIRGRLAASSYSSFSNSSAFNQRMRYTLALSADHISDSKFSTDTYITFTHQANHWAEVKSNIFNALKIYSLAVNYDVTEKSHIVFGRKINPRIASVGAIDGLQAETKTGDFTFGAVVGSNPDYTYYSFNPKLFEYGAYLSYDYKNKNGVLVNSFAFFQQYNKGKTDRRFVYFQQDNSLAKNINLFISCELDLYAMKNGLPTNVISLTSLYLSLQYRFSRQLSMYVSYDERKNIIYYETFKTFLDQMLQNATRQGYQFRINYRPTNLIASGVSGGYSSQQNDPHPMLNTNGYLSFSKVPWINASVNLSGNWLKSSYVDGIVYGIRIDRDIIPSKLSGGVFYRLVDYNYLNTKSKSLQQMADIDLMWQITRKIYFSANYDGTFDKSNNYHSIYISLVKRF